MEEPGSFKKTKRKVRCTQEFNQLDRKSLVSTSSTCSESKKKMSKKNNNFFYLPKIDMDFGSKENCSPNVSEKELSKRNSKNESSKDLFKNICNSDIKERRNKKNSTTSMDEERKDSTEVLFKKKKKKKKQLYFEEQSKSCSREDLSNIKPEGNSIHVKTPKQSERQNDIEQNFDTNEVVYHKVTRPRSTMKNLNENLPRKSTLKTTLASLSDLAPSPINSGDLSDNVFVDNFKLSETLECNNQLSSGPSESRSKKLNTFELQNSTFDVSQLSVIPSIKKDLTSSKNKGSRRSRSLNNEENVSNHFINVKDRKSVSFVKNGEGRKSSSLSRISSKINNTSSYNVSYSNRKSVRFTEFKNDTTSPIYKPNNSTKYRKSPYIRKLHSVQSKNENFSPEIDHYNLSQNLSPEIDQYNLSQHFSPEIEHYNLDKNKKKLFVISPNGTSSSFNETFVIISPTKSEESKITKRKQWNRSLGVSILDSTGLLHNISSPWEIKESDNSFSFSYGSTPSSENDLIELNCQIHSLQNKTLNCSTPAKNISSTERLDHISSAKIDCQSKKPSPVIMVNSVKQSKSTNAHVETLKWVASPIGKTTSSKKTSIQSVANKSNCKSSNKKTQMPNFALIHQKAFDKLENLKDMTERKALRTKLLLSGRKPDIQHLEVNSPRFKIKSPKSKKLLRFIPKRKSLDKKQPQATSLNASTKEKVAPSTSNPKVITGKSLNNKINSKIPKFTKNPLEDQKKSFTKLSLKSGADEKKILKQDQIKAIANKTNVVKNSIQTRRNAVQNVRSNRRFELLMQMRKGKN